MKFRTVLFLLALFLASMIILVPVRNATVRAEANIIRVPEDYSTIQEAINNAENGSTIQVNMGIYYEHLTINKSLTVTGADKQDTIIDNPNGTVVTITADNVTFEGFTVQHSSRFQGRGMVLDHSNNSIIHDNIISLNGVSGLLLSHCSNCTIDDNIVCSTIGSMVGLVFGNGIDLWYSTNNTVRNNIIANCTAAGIDLDTSTDNILFGNSIEKNGARIQVYSSSNNTFYHNNFLNFHETEPDNFGSNNNTWSTNSQGNYWSDYAGLDDGSNNRTASDGIGDTDLPWHGVDDNPLISPFNPVRVFWDNMGFPVYLTSNSTISSFNFDQPNKQITFSTKQPANTTGYFNISIPKTLLDRSAEQNWTLLIDNSNIASNYIITETESYSTIYLSYAGNRTVQIVGGYVIPEYSNFTLLLVMTLSTVLSLIILVKNKALPEPIRQSEEII